MTSASLSTSERKRYELLTPAGVTSGQTGVQATNSIPATATANLDLRLVVGIDAKTQQQRVVDYVRSQGYFVTSEE